MPVLITGATGFVGRALAQRLVADGAHVRAYVRRDDPQMRALGVHVAVGGALDVGRLEAALTRVHTIVHLVGGWWPARGETFDFLNRETTEAAVIAAVAAEVRRFLFLSFAGADPASANEFLTAKGKAEEHVRASGLEHAILRCAPILGPDGSPPRALPARGRSRVDPVPLADVVGALVAADAREATVRGTWDLGGRHEMTMDELARRNPSPRSLFGRPPRALSDLLARDVLAGRGEAAAQFGLEP